MIVLGLPLHVVMFTSLAWISFVSKCSDWSSNFWLVTSPARGRGFPNMLAWDRNVHSHTNICTALLHVSPVLTFALTFNGFCFDGFTSGYCQLSVLSPNSIKLMDTDATKQLLLLDCQDVACYSQSICHLFSHYHPILAGKSHYLLRDATITNCFKWILFISGGFHLVASLLYLSGFSQFDLSSSRIQTCL